MVLRRNWPLGTLPRYPAGLEQTNRQTNKRRAPPGARLYSDTILTPGNSDQKVEFRRPPEWSKGRNYTLTRRIPFRSAAARPRPKADNWAMRCAPYFFRPI